MKPFGHNYGGSYLITDCFGGSCSSSGGAITAGATSLSCPLSNSSPRVNGHGKRHYRNPAAWSYQFIDKTKVSGTFLLVGNQTFNAGRTITRTGVQDGSEPALPLRSNQNTVRNLALDRLNDRVRGSLDLSTALAESHKTVQMLKATAKILSMARGRMPPGGFGSSRDLANGYLQWKYGWKPLMSDIFDAANQSIDISINFISKVKGRAKITSTGGQQAPVWPIVGSVTNVPIIRRPGGGDGKPMMIEACEYGVTLGVPQSVHNASRWSSMNPISVTWELIPYSFVVDWFLDIGSYLRNFETGLLYSSVFQNGYVSELFSWNVVETCDHFGRQADPGDFFSASVSDLRAENHYIDFNRQVLSSYPLPSRPSFKADLGSSQLLSAAALLRQFVGGKSKYPKWISL